MAKCIYCFEDFLPIDAHFRAKKPISRINFETDDSPYVLDEKLKNYYMSKEDDDELTSTEKATILPWFTIKSENVIADVVKDPATNIVYVPKLIFNKDTYKSSELSTNERLCPHCHNSMPIGFGVKDTIILSLIGDTFSGKTVYLTVLINELLSGDNFFKASLIPIGEENVLREYIDDYTQKIYKERRLPQGTPEKKLPPLIYNYTYNYLDATNKQFKNSIDIVLYDIAGENCRDNNKLDKKGLNIKNSNGIILLLNPLAIDDILPYYDAQGMVSTNFDTNTDSQYKIISAIYKNFLSENNLQSEIPIACVISKSDIFSNKEVKLPFFDNHPYSKVLTTNYDGKSKHKGYLDKADIESLSNDVEEFLIWTKSNRFVSAIKNNFKHNDFFAMSALNQMPQVKIIDNNEVSEITTEIKPFRVLDPFYWILAKNGLLVSRTETVEKIKKRKKFFW